MLLKLDRYSDAELHLREAVNVWMRRGEANSELPMGEKWKEESYGDVLAILGRIYDRGGLREDAEACYLSAIEIYEAFGRSLKIAETRRRLVINLCTQVNGAWDNLGLKSY